MPATTLPVGTPLWRKPIIPGATSAERNSETRAIHPEETDIECTFFLGVTSREGEPVDSQIRIVESGRALARVKGPIAINDPIGLSPSHDYLVKDGNPACGKSLGSIENNSTKLIEVELGSIPARSWFSGLLLIEEGRDALRCSASGQRAPDDNEIIVMKPYELRVSKKCSSPEKFGVTLSASLDTDYMDGLPHWTRRGMVVIVENEDEANEEFMGKNSAKQRQALWPIYPGSISEGGSDRDKLLIANTDGILQTTIYAAAASSPVAYVDPETLEETDNTGTPVYHVDMNLDARRWETISDILMNSLAKIETPDGDVDSAIYQE